MSLWDKMHRKMAGFLFRNVPGMLTCSEFEGFIADYEDGELPRSKRWVFELHLAICTDCRRYLNSYRNAIALGKAVFEEPDDRVPTEVPEDLVKAILSARGREH